MFHLINGLYFQQLPDGAVRILKKDGGREDSPVIFDLTVDASQWSSVIASMSHYGEENGGFYRALSFHSGHLSPVQVITHDPDKRVHWMHQDVARDTNPPYRPIECGADPSVDGRPVARFGHFPYPFKLNEVALRTGDGESCALGHDNPSLREHTAPINDLAPHANSEECPCNPTIENTDGHDRVIHNQFDQ